MTCWRNGREAMGRKEEKEGKGRDGKGREEEREGGEGG